MECVYRDHNEERDLSKVLSQVRQNLEIAKNKVKVGKKTTTDEIITCIVKV